MKKLCFFITFLVLYSCAGRNRIPDGIIQQNKMQGILWDMIRAQALSHEIARKDSSISEAAETKILTQKIFEIHKVTSSAFDASYSWYTSHPEMMRIIFDSMNVHTQKENELRMQNNFKIRAGKNLFRRDSLKKIKTDEQGTPAR